MSKSFSGKFTIGAVAVAAGLFAAQSSQAATIITSTAFDVGSKTGTINFSPSNLSESAAVGRFKLTGYDDVTKQAVSFLSYCVDLFQPLGTGTFTAKKLSDYSVSATKQNQLNALIANTAGIANTSTASAAVQLAVWEILYEYNTNSNYSLTGGYLTATGSDLTSARTLANTYVSNVTSGIWGTDASYTLGLLSSGSKQDQLYYTKSTQNQVGEVPEPASWAMFIGGFGLVGGALRTRRTKVAFA